MKFADVIFNPINGYISINGKVLNCYFSEYGITISHPYGEVPILLLEIPLNTLLVDVNREFEVVADKELQVERLG